MNLSWSDEDQAWIVMIPELPGCFADGPTPEEAIANAQEVMRIWLETAQEDGMPIPEPQHYELPASA
jgi:predicted RNase H-like HicB family nuclease